MPSERRRRKRGTTRDMMVQPDPPVDGFVVGGQVFATAAAPPLVTAPRCTTSPPCGRCWYCRTARDGENWWQWPPVPTGKSGARRGRP